MGNASRHRGRPRQCQLRGGAMNGMSTLTLERVDEA
jgi:hypothetical protein